MVQVRRNPKPASMAVSNKRGEAMSPPNQAAARRAPGRIRPARGAAQRIKGLVWREAATQSPVEPSRTQAPLHLEIKPSGISGKRGGCLRFSRDFLWDLGG